MAPSTKARLATALKRELESTPLDRVTVAALAERAGISRQAFYYHFADILDLAVWTFEEDVANHIMDHASLAEWQDGYRTLLEYMDENFDQTSSVLRSLDHRERDRFFLAQFRQMMTAVINEIEAQTSTTVVLDEDDRQFIIDHYAAMMLGHFLQWISKPVREAPSVLVSRIAKVLAGSVKEALRRFDNRSVDGA